MSVHLSVVYKAQFIADLTSEAINSPKAWSVKAAKEFDAFVEETLAKKYYEEVEVDEQYKRYGLDIGLSSTSKEKLADACHDIAIYTRQHPYLKNIEFDFFE